MLHFIIGRSGSGKSETIYQQLCDRAWAGQGDLILLVPEQFSYESERRLLKLLGPRLANTVQVLSFTRLAQYIFREVGGLAGRRLDDTGRLLLMSRAYEQVADHLSLYAAPHFNSDMIDSLVALQTELKQYGVSPYQLETMVSALPEGPLRQKTQELSLILTAYEALTATAGAAPTGCQDDDLYIDPLDDLTILAQRLLDSQRIRRAHIFVDSFKGFTHQEREVLRILVRLAPEVTVALCADRLDDPDAGMGLFSPVIRLAAQLRDLAYQDGVKIAAPLYLLQNQRARNEALRTAEAGCYAILPTEYGQETQAVTLVDCHDRYEECTAVARTIRRLLREEGGRCQEFAIVARDLEPYRGLLSAALKRQGLPFYQDERVDVANEPLMVLLSTALEVCTLGYRTGLMLRLMKTGLLGFSAESVAKLENYVLLWQIEGNRWRQPFHSHPDGFSLHTDADSQRRLEHLNRLRRRLVEPLEHLRRCLVGKLTGERFAKALYRYALSTHTDRLIRLHTRRLHAQGEPALADRMARLWDVCMELLDRIAVLFGGSVLPAARLSELFQLGIGAIDLGAIPQSLDAIQIGAADRIRFAQPRVVWILGANEGVFPATPAPSGLINEEERRTWIAQGLPLRDLVEEQAADERLLAYFAVAAPSEKLYVSYARHTSQGEPLSPSSLVDSLSRCLPACRRWNTQTSTELSAESEDDLFACAASAWREDSPQAAAMRRVFEERPAYAMRRQALQRAAQRLPHVLQDSYQAQRLFGRDMLLSASKVETYHRCRFSYFCQYGLRAKARRAADLDALTFGTLTHHVMEQLLPGYVQEGLNKLQRSRVFADTKRVVHAYAEQSLGGLDDKPTRFTALLDRLMRVAGTLLWQAVRELRQSRFVPIDYELAIGPAEEGQPALPAVALTLPDGTRVRVQGKIDRVDVYYQGETAYVRVVDYKTGAKEFRLSDVVEGINAQMLMYLFAVWEGGEPRYGQVTPAGVLYMPAKLPVLTAQRDAPAEQIDKEQTRLLRMNGLLLDNPEIVRAMEHDAQGLFIPARLDSHGRPARGSALASLEQFGQLKRRLDTLLVHMAETLRDGDIAAVPLKSDDTDACAYCAYRTVCGYEVGDPVRTLLRRDNDEVWADLTAGEKGGDHG